MLESIDKIDVVDKYTVKFTLNEPNAWFLDMLASTSTWIIAKECVEKFGDLKKVESVVGTGPWMLERWEPNVRLIYVRHPNYFVPGLPYADGVEVLIDKDPSSRLAALLAGKLGLRSRVPAGRAPARSPRGQAAQARAPDSPSTRGSRAAPSGFKIDKPPFNDIRVRRALSRATNHGRDLRVHRLLAGPLDPESGRPGRLRRVVDPHRPAHPRGPKALRVLDSAEAKRCWPRPAIRTGSRRGGGAGDRLRTGLPGRVQITVKNWKAAGIDAELKLKEYGAFISTTIYGKFDHMFLGLRGAWIDPEAYFYRPYMPGQPLNVLNVNDPKLTDMIKLQRRTFDVAKRKQIVYDIQRYLAEQAYSARTARPRSSRPGSRTSRTTCRTTASTTAAG